MSPPDISAAISPIDVAVAIIAKEPVPGRVKTRLCPPCTPDQAANIAAAALADTMEVVAGVTAGRRVLVLDGRPGEWVADGFDVVVQRGGPFAERLANAARDVGGPVVIIGMDTPQLDGALLGEVVTKLCSPGCDAVIGFANDGGYWVIALRTPDDEVFADVPMSTSVTGTRQHDRLLELGLTTAVVAGLTDVDNFDEARAVATSAPGSRFAAAVAAVAVAGTRWATASSPQTSSTVSPTANDPATATSA